MGNDVKDADEDRWNDPDPTEGYGLGTRLQFHLPGLRDHPRETCPLPMPRGDWTRLVLSLPTDDQPTIRSAFRRLLATQNIWDQNDRWWLDCDFPAEWVTSYLVDEEEPSTAWDLHLVPSNSARSSLGLPTAHLGIDTLSTALDTVDTQSPSPPYGGCQAIVIHREQLERLCYLVQHTLSERLRAMYWTVTVRCRRQARSQAREVARTQLTALAAIHDHLPPEQITHRPRMDTQEVSIK